MKVKNITGVSDKKCNCESWLKHWENSLGRKAPSYCITGNCYKSASLGGHIIKVDGTDKNHYIIPICSICNAKTEDYFVADGYFVLANQSKTCNK